MSKSYTLQEDILPRALQCQLSFYSFKESFWLQIHGSLEILHNAYTFFCFALLGIFLKIKYSSRLKDL